MHYSQERNSVLLNVVHAQTDEELKAAHAAVTSKLSGKNIWVVLTPNKTLLSRDWPDSPNGAMVTFPDQSTAVRVCEEIGLPQSKGEFEIGVMSHKQALETADHNSLLLVMVTYDGETPHYVPLSHFA